MNLGKDTLQREKLSVFHFNSGKQGKAMPDYNPYTIRRCNDCDVAKGNVKLSFVPDNELCQVCKFLHSCENNSHTQQFYDYRAETVREATKWTGYYENLQTENYYQTKKALKRAIAHAKSIEQVEIYSKIKQVKNVSTNDAHR